MLKKKDDGTFHLPSIGRTITPPDTVKHRQAKATKADPEDVPFRGVVSEALGLRKIQARIDQITSRDSVAQRAALSKFYEATQTDLMRADTLTIPKLLKACRDLKPAAARTELKESLPATLAAMRDRLAANVQAHHDGRVKPAREALAAALAPEVPSDPGAAAALAVERMEVRARLLALPEAERVKVVAKAGERGDLSLLGAVKSDPLGGSLGVPADVMAAAERMALDAAGAGFLVEAVEDAEAESATLVALAGTLYNGAITEFSDVDAPAELIQTPRDFTGFAPKS